MAENTDVTNDLNNPHDRFFKGALGLLIVAKPMIEAYLPKDLLDKLDLDTLEIDPNSYINDELKENFSDLVWSCQLKGSKEERKIAFLLEHKSYNPRTHISKSMTINAVLGKCKLQRIKSLCQSFLLSFIMA